MFKTVFIYSFITHGIVSSLDCSFKSSYPRQYVSHKLQESEMIVVDGDLDDEAWEAVDWSEEFQDISTDVVPRLRTRVKMRWDSDWLYVGAEMEETQIWANITETCHCIDDSQDQVIFHDNDFEIFVDVDGTNHNYKEFEVNAANATWILLLNKPYSDGGYENSSRVFGSEGYDMQPPLTCATHVDPHNALNNPSVPGNTWTSEVALPIDKLMERSIQSERPRHGSIWRINFSRVEWRVKVEDGLYVKNPEFPHEDNWVWSGQGEISMHLPERWGVLQFSEDAPEVLEMPETGVDDEEWTLRQVAMSVYYAQHYYADHHSGVFTDDIFQLSEHVTYPPQDPDRGIILGECTNIPEIKLRYQLKQQHNIYLIFLSYKVMIRKCLRQQ